MWRGTGLEMIPPILLHWMSSYVSTVKLGWTKYAPLSLSLSDYRMGLVWKISLSNLLALSNEGGGDVCYSMDR